MLIQTITESWNHRIREWLTFEATSGDHLVQPCCSSMSRWLLNDPRRETPQTPCTTCASAWSLISVKNYFLILKNLLSFSLCHWKEPGLPYRCLYALIRSLHKSPPRFNNPSSLNLSSYENHNHLSGLLLEFLQCVHVSPVWGSPELDTVKQVKHKNSVKI